MCRLRGHVRGAQRFARASARLCLWLTHRRKGACICPNALVVPMGDADAAILDAVEATLLHPAVVTTALEYVRRGARS